MKGKVHKRLGAHGKDAICALDKTGQWIRFRTPAVTERWKRVTCARCLKRRKK